jgi:Tfp pilus assembly protein PilN
MPEGTQWAQRQGPPRIDLLPRELVEQRLLRRQRGGVGAAFLVLVALLGLWYVVENGRLADAQDQADQERAVASGLRARRAQLQPLADLEAQIAAADQLRAQVYAHEIRFSTVMHDIAAIVPEDVWLTSMTAALNAGGDQAAASAPASGQSGTASGTPGSPGTGSPVANITFAGSGLGHVDVGGFLRALARGPKKGGQPVYLNPYFTSSQKADASGQTTVTFNATVDLSTAAYSGRYQTQNGTVTP